MSKKNITKKIDPNLKLTTIEPLTENQEKVFNSNKNLVLHGSAGTGKTLVSSYLGYKAVLNRYYNYLVYIRSAVPTRNIGFLPGTEAEKTQVYEQPYRQIATELFDRGDAYDSLKHSEAVKFITTSHIRGINLTDCFIIVDECQNMTYQELDSIITRVGKRCRLVFCGDYYQRDLRETGIREFYNILQEMNEFDFINFTIDDVVRSDLVKNYLKAKYEKGNFEQSDISDSRGRISKLLTTRANLQNSELQQSFDTYNYSELFPVEKGTNFDTDR